MFFRQISKDSDVVVSSRVRFARSVDGYKFPHIMNKTELNKIISLIEDSIDKKKYNFFKMKDIDENTEYSLMEQHLISKEFVGNENGAIVVNEDSTLVTMINEEDHLRIQAFEAGFNVDKCYERLTTFTNSLEKKLKFAKTEDYGYITACPTNVGSAMRVSVLLHLPALNQIGLLRKLLDQASSIGLSVRGLYGENTEGDGYMYQISNQKTLGKSDEDIIANIKAVVTSIIEQERKAREILKDTDISLEDDIYRAYGILTNARIIKEEEALNLLSKLRLGVSIEIIKNVDLRKVQSLMTDIEPYTLKLILKEDLNDDEDVKRAEYIRRELE